MRLGILAAVALLLFSASAVAQTPSLYGVRTSPNNNVYTISTITGAATQVGSVGRPRTAAIRHDTGELFFTNTSNELRKSAPSGASNSLVCSCSIGTSIGAAFRDKSTLYLTNSTNQLYMVNVAAGSPSCTLVGAMTGLTGTNADITFGPSGEMYIVTSALTLYRMNLPSLAATSLGSLAFGATPSGLAYWHKNSLLASDTSQLYRIDLSGLTMTALPNSTGQTINDLGAVTAHGDLSLAMEASSLTPAEGSTLIIKLTVTHQGTDNVNGVRVTYIPAGLTYVSDDSAGAYSAGIWTVGTLTPGTSKVINITLTATGSGPQLNFAEITGTSAIDPDSHPNSGIQVEDDYQSVTITIADPDGDGIPSASDNCPSVSNANQLNTDGDAQGDACDLDDDNDGTVDGTDNCPFIPNPSQADGDSDGTGDTCETAPASTGVFYASSSSTTTPEISQVNPLTGVAAVVGNLAFASAAITTHADTGWVYYAGWTGADTGKIYAWNPLSQTNINLQASLPSGTTYPRAAFISDNVILFGGNSNNGQVYRVDITTYPPTVTFAGTLSDTSLGGGDFAVLNGTLYLVSATNLYTINTTTWAVSLVGAMTGLQGGAATGLGVRNENQLLVSTAGNIVNVVNAQTGAVITSYSDQTPIVLSDLASITQFGDLSLSLAADSSNIVQGENVIFTLTLTNNGPDRVAQATVRELFPAGFSYISHTGDGIYSPVSGNWINNAIFPGTSVSIEITAQAISSGDISNTVEVFSSSAYDPDSTPWNNDPLEDDQHTVVVTVAPDPDGDGVADPADNCPLIANPAQTDSDGDGTGNACDACPSDPANDIDGDGVCGDTDNCPTTANVGQQNVDGDSLGDACDICPNDAANDADGDGVCGDVDNCPATSNSGQENNDGDATGDICDSDDDNDGTPDTADCASFDDTAWQNQAYPDVDGDGVRDSSAAQTIACFGTTPGAGYTQNTNGPDNCPAVTNPSQDNFDGDTEGDACDSDDDNDGTNDPSDCSQFDNTTWQNQAYPDGDSDGVRDSTTLASISCFGNTPPSGYTLATNGPDNCPTDPNISQDDNDGDGLGDACDPDDDNDGTADGPDCEPFDDTKWQNQAYPDADNDGVRNSTTLETISCFGSSPPTGHSLAINGPDNCPGDANPGQDNNDGDATGDACDTDDDNDGTPDVTDCSPFDDTAWQNQAYPDSDGDGVRDSTTAQSVTCFGTIPPSGYTTNTNGPDNCPGVANASQDNFDGDLDGDACDSDDDNDGTPDASDCTQFDNTSWQDQAFPDGDNDGVRNSTTLDTISCFGVSPPAGHTLATNGPDNCPADANAGQEDNDGDGLGDACDPDDDNDGTPDISDCEPLDDTKWQNQAYPDGDNDGVRESTSLATISCFGVSPPAGHTLVTNGPDNCPTDANSGQEDNDGDGLGDTCDPDDDNDGTPDASDCQPFDDTKWQEQAYPDLDEDTVRDSTTAQSVACFGTTPPAGYTTDTNGPDNCSGVANTSQDNFDGDAEGDACDSDDDNDGTPDTSDCTQFDNTSWQNQAYPDGDNDGVRNSTSLDTISCFGASPPAGHTLATNGPDNCPADANSGQDDNDGDGQGDACDPDDDNDGTPDTSDCEPFDDTKWQNQAYPDGDNDGVRNSTSLATISCFGASPPAGHTLATNGPDNCPTDANAGQENNDGDAEGDACDSDDDNDGTPDTSDCAPFDNTAWRDQAYPDADGDTVRDSTTAQSVACFGTTPPSGYTTNTNGPDNCSGVANTSQENFDGDAEGDACDTDDDNDSTPDTSDCTQFDNTSWQNQAYPDGDNDGVRNSTSLDTISCFGASPPAGHTLATNGPDNCPSDANTSQDDNDGDGLGDACDPDDDNDGTPDASDCEPFDDTKWQNQAYPDGDNDGVRNSTSLATISCFGTSPPTGHTLATNGPDNCPTDANAGQENNDGDAAGDACDPDDDNDGTPDTSDCAPFDDTAWRSQAYPDTDGDTVRDSTTAQTLTCFGTTPPAGYTTNTNGPDNCSGVANTSQDNFDGDTEGDACDTDDDNDGTADASDCTQFDNTSWQNQAYPDADGDDVRESSTIETVSCFGSSPPAGYTLNVNGPDNCPAMSNSGQADSDGDGLGDACDTCPNDSANDNDGDGVCGDIDNCPSTSNPAQENADSDSFGDACDVCANDPLNDIDWDAVCGDVDNCPNDANTSQDNADSDSLGDVCDACPNDPDNDADGDSVCGEIDNCPVNSNSGQEDGDSDGLGDACDLCPADSANDTDGDGVCGDVDNCPTTSNSSQTNADSDQFGDVCDSCPNDANNDLDTDGVCGDIDNCPSVANTDQANADGDSLGNACDSCPNDAANDADGDSVCGDVDNCPTTGNTSQTNTDGDSLGDACDTCPNDVSNDSDGDGVCGDVDNCPVVANSSQTNTDGDSLGNDCDICPNDAANDTDGDGVCGDVDNCSTVSNATQDNVDGDALGDACDTCVNDANNDADGDGVCGDIDNCPFVANSAQENADGDTSGDACDSCPNDPANDADGDTVCGDVDNCPTLANGTQENADGDAFGDVCDSCANDPNNDADSDTICGDVDNCPSTSNQAQTNTDGDSLGDACDSCPNDSSNDADGDGVCGDIDNCAAVANALQENGDGDQFGDACDTCPNDAANDVDGDTVCGDVDNCPTVSNAGQDDFDSDTQGDLCDNDADGDGLINAIDENSDIDGDGTPSWLDLDSDNDGVPDTTEGSGDLDGDGRLNHLDLDSDGDGISDLIEVGESDTDSDGVVDGFNDVSPKDGQDDQTALSPFVIPDSDSDGVPDYLDIDSDNDGIVDNVEAQLTAAYQSPIGVDSDGDGVDDAYDVDAIGGVPLSHSVDTDSDATPDLLDQDSDGDLVSDLIEGNDADFDGATDILPVGSDSDNDGLDDALDTIAGPATGNSTGTRAVLQNFDGTDDRDWRDTDDDNDGVITALEDANNNTDPTDDDADSDNFPDYLDIDADNDTIPDDVDNCPTVANQSQTDSDGDSVGDACDTDSDNDGIPDTTDNCPTVPNSAQTDTDNDGSGDDCDVDDDGDGVDDPSDNCPLVVNAAQTDVDNDGIGDACDPLIDQDGDGIPDSSDNCPTVSNSGQTDTDNDGIGNACDTDNDNDGVPDVSDNCPTVPNASQTDIDGDGQGDACDSNNDTDGDGVDDSVDNCPTTINTNQLNSDGDSSGDACDPDDDNDGVPDTSDNCPLSGNANQANNDGDSLGDVCDPDDDNDTIFDVNDNCPLIANQTQTDKDNDSVGDVCDDDDDGDAIDDPSDNCPLTANSNQGDNDNDGIGDFCDDDDDDDTIPDNKDNCPYNPNKKQEDSDRDGKGDACTDFGQCQTSDGGDCIYDGLEPTGCVGVNGFLGMRNVLSVINLREKTLRVDVEYRDLFGVVQGKERAYIESYIKKDFDVNAFGLMPDTYGTVCVRTNATTKGSWMGSVTLYKPNFRPGASNGRDFALNYSIRNPFTGVYTLPLNTFHLGTEATSTVANWINITDASGKGLEGKIEYFDAQGQVVHTDTVKIPPNGRFDFSGHDALAGTANADAVGMATFTPKKLKGGALATYYITNTRYFYDCFQASCGDFLTAFVMPHRPSTNLMTFGGVSTMDGEISIVELNNVTAAAVKTTLKFFDVNGDLAGKETLSVPSRATRHVIVNRAGDSGFFTENSVGSVQISTDGGFISASTLFYKLE